MKKIIVMVSILAVVVMTTTGCTDKEESAPTIEQLPTVLEETILQEEILEEEILEEDILEEVSPKPGDVNERGLIYFVRDDGVGVWASSEYIMDYQSNSEKNDW